MQRATPFTTPEPTHHCAAQLLALAQLDVVPVARAALRAAAGIARHTSCKEELLAEGALQLLLRLVDFQLHSLPVVGEEIFHVVVRLCLELQIVVPPAQSCHLCLQLCYPLV